MLNFDNIRSRLEAAVPGCRLEIISNPGPAAQHSLLVGAEHALVVARWLRSEPELQFDYLSNVTGVDWPEQKVKETVKTWQVIDGNEREIAETRETVRPGFLEVVYHLYSISLKHDFFCRFMTQSAPKHSCVASISTVLLL